ncbi:histidine phosphotransferase family protein [Sneathiella marina]|uniref:Histidine phosphotransferase family protein n=1 Tax=Sneathiella marina TaxID=2950108 RepID=A0ABY4W0Y8_9PROT|nr:histidine phosphotransferase family protein [Sneathiella marina]USG60526.1 histidine phosphotransferase family protein [Sneathiella marina]
MIDLKLAALMSSKLCHDVIGPVGAVSNGIELLQDEGNEDMREQALELVSQSASEASARLQFYRLAFGLAGGMGPEISLREARTLCREFMSYGKIAFTWPDEAGGAENLPKDVIKIICNLVVLASGALPRGGELSIDGSVTGRDWSFTYTAYGPRAGLREEVTTALLNGYDDAALTAQNVGTYYIMALVENTGAKLDIVSMDESEVVLSVRAA